MRALIVSLMSSMSILASHYAGILTQHLNARNGRDEATHNL
jgi:hypothetical protein